MLPKLAGFIKFLEDNGLVEFDILDDGEAQFTNRLKIQKYVFFAKRYGMPFRYRHGMYLYGPYSSELTADYYSLAHNAGRYTADALPVEFRREDFLRNVRNDPGWLEVAATIISKNDSIKERNALVESVWHMKSQFGRPYVEKVLGELEDRSLVSFGTTT